MEALAMLLVAIGWLMCSTAGYLLIRLDRCRTVGHWETKDRIICIAVSLIGGPVTLLVEWGWLILAWWLEDRNTR